MNLEGSSTDSRVLFLTELILMDDPAYAAALSGKAGGPPNSEAAAREAMRSSMATHLPSVSTDDVKKLVDFAFENGLRSPAAFEHITPERFNSVPTTVLSFGLCASLVQYAKIMYKPTPVSSSGGAPAAAAPADPGSSRPVIALHVNANTDIEQVNDVIKKLDPTDVPNPSTEEVFKSLCLDDLSPDIMPPAEAAKAAQKAVTTGAPGKASFYSKPVSEKFGLNWAQGEKVKDSSPESGASAHFGSVFGFIAALHRFLLMTVTLNSAGRSMWDVPPPAGSPHAADSAELAGGHARRMGRMFNYFYTLMEVAHRAQQEPQPDGKKVGCVKLSFGFAHIPGVFFVCPHSGRVHCLPNLRQVA